MKDSDETFGINSKANLAHAAKILNKKVLTTTDDKYHSAFLIQEIANILKQNNLEMKDVDVVGIDVGPGSFTGIRACTTIGRVIAQQMDLPLVASSSMEILSKIFDKEKVAVVLDARKKSAYIAIYENEKEKLNPQIISLNDLPKVLRKENCKIVFAELHDPAGRGGDTPHPSETDNG